MRHSMLFTVAALAFAASANAQTAEFPDAAASDPVTIGWMTGSPVPPEKIIRFDEGDSGQFPKSRWSYSHQRELMPTVNVARGNAPVSHLARSERSDIDTVSFMPIGGTRPMTWEQSLAANYTDGIVVLHKGRIVYERYFGALKPDGQHLAFSATKSFVGVIAATLIAEGKLDASATIASYIPELAASGFGDATVRQVLDMTTSLAYNEVYADPKSDVHDLRRASGRFPRPPGYSGPISTSGYLMTLRKDGEHGKGFAYKTPNTELLGWLIRRVTGKPLATVFQERLWTRLGTEQDAYFSIDSTGVPSAGAGLSLGLRDMARFGEMMRLGGRFNGKQIVPAAVVASIAKGGAPEKFNKPAYPTLPGGSYANQWWFTHNQHGAYAARGIHGQAIYIDPKAEMVIARFASHPIAGNVGIDPTSLPAYHALAKHLMKAAR